MRVFIYLESFALGQMARVRFGSKADILLGTSNVRYAPAISTDRRNTCVKSFRRRFERKRLAGSFVQLPCDLVQLRLRVYR